MNIPKPLDYFDTNVYNQIKGCDKMKSFMESEHNIKNIILACLVDSKTARKVHINRASHGLVLYTKGDTTFVFDTGKRVRVTKNDLVYLPKGSNYTVEKNSFGAECYAINYLTYEDISYEPFSFKTKNASLFLELYKKADKAWKSSKKTGQMECKAILYTIICDLIKEFEAGYTSKSLTAVLNPAIEFIDENLTSDTLSVSLLAKLCGISETYLRKLFLKSYGTSPVKYIRTKKILRAKALLSSGLYSVAEVAELSGWGDEAYFSREFKKATGVSPSDYS